jgi:hypothetical protein
MGEALAGGQDRGVGTGTLPAGRQHMFERMIRLIADFGGSGPQDLDAVTRRAFWLALALVLLLVVV